MSSDLTTVSSATVAEAEALHAATSTLDASGVDDVELDARWLSGNQQGGAAAMSLTSVHLALVCRRQGGRASCRRWVSVFTQASKA